LAAHGVRLADGEIEWSPELRPLSVRADGVAWYAADDKGRLCGAAIG
jgi:hypothetical protein